MSEDESEQERSPKLRTFYKLFFTTETMIKLIRDFPIIWDRNLPEYRDKVSRQQAWEDVYRRLEPSYDGMSDTMRSKIGQQISKKWFNVRDTYLKSRKDGGRTRRPYIYTRLLSFLDPFISLSDKNTDDTIYIEEEHLLDEETENMLNVPSFVYVDESERNEEPERSRDRPRKKPRFEFNIKKEQEYSEDNTSSVFSEFNKIIEREEDADRAFFTSVIPIVKSLSAEAKLEFQIQLLKLLKEIKKKDETEIGFD